MPCPSIAAGIVGEISSISLFYFHPSYTTVKLLGGGENLLTTSRFISYLDSNLSYLE